MSSRFRTLQLNRRAIVYGCLTDIGATIAATVLVSIIAGAASSEPASLRETIQSPGFVALQFILGLAATIFGGYVAARRSPARRVDERPRRRRRDDNPSHTRSGGRRRST